VGDQMDSSLTSQCTVNGLYAQRHSAPKITAVLQEAVEVAAA
jgi:hypothetical protein